MDDRKYRRDAYTVKKYGPVLWLVARICHLLAKLLQAWTKNVLKISGKASENTEEYLHRGISARNFVRTFSVADNIEIKDATLVNGMLKVFLDAITPSKEVKKIEVKDE